MNIKRVIKKAGLEERIRSFTKMIPLSIYIKDKHNKTILTFSDNCNEALFNYPVTFNGETVGELGISKKGPEADFILQLIIDAFAKEQQIANINDETLLLYREINLLYDFFKVSSDQTNVDQRLNCFLERCVNYLQVGRASIWIIEGDTLRCTHYRGFKPVKIFKLGEGFIGQVAMSGNAEMLNCPICDQRWEGNVNNKISIIASPLIACDRNIGVLHLCRDDETLFTAKDLKLANVFAHHGAQEIEISKLIEKVKSELKKRDFIKTTFERYVSHNVVDEIIKNPDMIHLGGQKKTLTIFFTDIGNFTNLSEILSPEEVVNYLNDYFQGMCAAILEYDGTINRFQGDAILAFWGAPIAQDNHALLACQAALRCREFLKHLEEKWVAGGLPPRTYRFGINTGEVVVGNVGSSSRFEYMAVGEDVSLASRLEGANKHYGTQILISERTYSLIKDALIAREIDIIRVVGNSKPVKIYELVAEKGKSNEKTARQLEHFEAGVCAYRVRQWEKAISCFIQVLQLTPEDNPAKIYIKRCIEYQQVEPPHNWEGIHELTVK
jgi:class 3 adenylate cyclase